MFDAGRHSISFFGCRSPCRLDTAQPCRSRGRACLARKGARGWAFAARSSPPEQADSHARAGPVLQEERRCDCGTSALVKLILVGRHSYSRGAVDGMNMPVAIDIPLCSMPASIIYPPHCHRRFATTGALRISRGELRTGHGPCGGCGIRSSMPATGSCPHVSYAGRLTYSCRYHAGRHSYSGSTHRFPDFAIADCEAQDGAVQSRGKLLGPAQWPRECPTAAQQAQALKVPVRCLGCQEAATIKKLATFNGHRLWRAQCPLNGPRHYSMPAAIKRPIFCPKWAPGRPETPSPDPGPRVLGCDFMLIEYGGRYSNLMPTGIWWPVYAGRHRRWA